jgi:SecD/SecF fusion protein
VIGYSINDTVVVFDRIREFFNKYTRQTKEEVINGAINSTVSRTVITSLTTLFVVAVLFVFGGSSIKGFAFALLVGIVVGTYSSIFIATPIMSDLTGAELRAKPTKEKGGKTSMSKMFQSSIALKNLGKNTLGLRGVFFIFLVAGRSHPNLPLNFEAKVRVKAKT